MSQSGSNQEIEIKLRVPDPEAAQRLITYGGFQLSVPRVFEENTVYDTPDKSLFRRGALLRLRRAGDRYTLTVKGQSANGKHKSRQEDEVIVSDYGIAHRMLVQLGYEPVFRYEKYRTEFTSTSQSGTITIDETPIGTFLELEGDPSWIDETARHLNFKETDYVLESYGRLYFEYCRNNGQVPSNMVFDK